MALHSNIDLFFENEISRTPCHLKSWLQYLESKTKPLDKYIIYELCYAVVLPSDIRSEAFGISLIEGAMFGKPLISCEISTGTSYININDLNGIVVKPRDYIDLKKAIIYLWNNPEIALKMGIESKKRYENLFTSAMMVRSYKSIYMKLLNIN